MTLSELQIEVGKWAQKNFPKALPHQPLLGAVEELGELSHSHLKMEQGIRASWDEHFDGKCDAIGDVVIFLAHYCCLNNILLQGVVDTTWAKVKQRDWVGNPMDGGEHKAQDVPSHHAVNVFDKEDSNECA